MDFHIGAETVLLLAAYREVMVENRTDFRKLTLTAAEAETLQRNGRVAIVRNDEVINLIAGDLVVMLGIGEIVGKGNIH